jgi:hypothetical protein
MRRLSNISGDFMIKKIVFSIHIFLTLCFGGAVHASDYAEPVMIVRFKNPDTNYHSYLSLLIKKTKNQPLHFKIISLYPKSANAEASMQQASFKAHKMLNDLVTSGVSLDKISINYKENDQVEYLELYLYATL